MKRHIVTGLLAIAAAGCSFGQDKSNAENAVVRFHASLDAGRYDAIYETTSRDFREATSRDDLSRFLATVHDRLGPVANAEQKGWRVNYGTNGNMVNLNYETRFASGIGTEEFVYRISGNAAELVGYHVNSPRLAGANLTSSADQKPGGKP